MRCQHDGGAKQFKCFWHKLNCRNFPYMAAKDKKRAEALANEWLDMMGKKYGLVAPPITF